MFGRDKQSQDRQWEGAALMQGKVTKDSQVLRIRPQKGVVIPGAVKCFQGQMEAGWENLPTPWLAPSGTISPLLDTLIPLAPSFTATHPQGRAQP